MIDLYLKVIRKCVFYSLLILNVGECVMGMCGIPLNIWLLRTFKIDLVVHEKIDEDLKISSSTVINQLDFRQF